jgi:hypothetical protein
VRTVANSNSASIRGGLGAGNSSASFVITGNGANSNNWITAGINNTNSIDQGNSAHITNDVDSDAKTGGNDAGFNTGGNVEIHSGNAMSGATVDNMVNFNQASLDCGCVTDVLAKIGGNGAGQGEKGSVNGIVLTLGNLNTIGQDNGDCLFNDVDANAKTGYNDANANTGSVMGSDPSITTGNATNTTGVSNSGNVNTVGGTPFVIPMPGNTNMSFSFSLQALMAFFGMSA